LEFTKLRVVPSCFRSGLRRPKLDIGQGFFQLD
jgi:hypothetical protein